MTFPKIEWKAEVYPHDSYTAFLGDYELGVGPSYVHKGQMAWGVKKKADPFWDMKCVRVCASVEEGKRLAEEEAYQLNGMTLEGS